MSSAHPKFRHKNLYYSLVQSMIHIMTELTSYRNCEEKVWYVSVLKELNLSSYVLVGLYGQCLYTRKPRAPSKTTDVIAENPLHR